jgi:hypothetical protein
LISGGSRQNAGRVAEHGCLQSGLSFAVDFRFIATSLEACGALGGLAPQAGGGEPPARA